MEISAPCLGKNGKKPSKSTKGKKNTKKTQKNKKNAPNGKSEDELTAAIFRILQERTEKGQTILRSQAST